jgi:hypothetical protein
VTRYRLEYNTESAEKPTDASHGGAESGAFSTSGSGGLPSELTEIIAKWSRLPTEVQAVIIAIARIFR